MKDQDSNKSGRTYSYGEVKMSKYQPINIKPSYGLQYTMNGDLNKNFKTYRDLYDDSPTNNSIIKGYINYIIGDGLELKGGNIYQYLDADDLQSAVEDLKVQGGFAFLVYWLNGTPLRLSYIDIEKIAVVIKKGTFEHESYKFCLDWNDRYRYKIIDYPKFTGKDNGNKIELLYVRSSKRNIFPVPDWIAGVSWAKVEAELVNSAVTFLEENINALTIVNINSGRIDDDVEAKMKADEVRDQVGGSRSRILVHMQEGAEFQTIVDRIRPPDLNQQNVFYTEEAEKSIIKAHSAPSILFSASQTSTGFSNNADERKEALKEAYRRNIQPYRNIFINGILPFFKLISATSELEFVDFDMVDELENDAPILDDTTLNAQAQLKGSVGGVQSLLEVQTSYANGTTSYESAIAILDLIFGFNREQAIRLLGNPEKTI